MSTIVGFKKKNQSCVCLITSNLGYFLRYHPSKQMVLFRNVCFLSKGEPEDFSLLHLYNTYLTSLDYWLRAFFFLIGKLSQGIEKTHTQLLRFLNILFQYFLCKNIYKYMQDTHFPKLDSKQINDHVYNLFS